MKINNENSPVLVAYAEDHVAVRKGITSYLHYLGDVNIIIEASNGKELITKLEKSDRWPDICLLDIKMPEMNGFETVSVIKKKWPDMKMLILSTFSEELYVVRMIRAGVNGYLSKSCEPTEIKKALIAIRDKGIYYSDLFLQKMTIAAQEHKLKTAQLTEKELCFLKHCCSDLTYIGIAKLMKCTPKSVEGYRDSLFRKLRVSSRVSLALFAVQLGIILIDNGPAR
ncbi:response regulator transcription factor [Taibaiella koreensis]|uniref:response regulator transcription factor n=1 Tax=Taibaiella koreensis TaxID=1268548 RepID=UPI000E59C6EA|nr:response regulator transcription factor [Taibaiella koreensis]